MQNLMRQLLLTSNKALVARMPRPGFSPHEVLVKVHYSMVSVGTELATLQPPQGVEPGLTLEKAKAYSSSAKSYLGKALRDPHKAAAKIKQMGKNWLNTLTPPSKPLAKPIAVNDLEWQIAKAQSLQLKNKQVILETDDSSWDYQALTTPIPVPQGHASVVEIRGVLTQGKVS